MKTVTRTNYMQRVMNDTYSGVAMEAITGGFAGAWERLIARRLTSDAQRDNSEAVLILESCGNDVMKAAYLVTGSTIEGESKPKPKQENPDAIPEKSHRDNLLKGGYPFLHMTPENISTYSLGFWEGVAYATELMQNVMDAPTINRHIGINDVTNHEAIN